MVWWGVVVLFQVRSVVVWCGCDIPSAKRSGLVWCGVVWLGYGHSEVAATGRIGVM